MLEFEKAKDKINMGPWTSFHDYDRCQRKYRLSRSRKYVIVGYLVPEHDPAYKVTIIPRGRSLAQSFTSKVIVSISQKSN